MTVAIEEGQREQGVSPPTRPAPSGRKSRDAVRRLTAFAVGALVVIGIALGVFQLFEGPLAREWYTLRQHQLASQFSSARPHTGSGAAVAVVQVPRLGLNVVATEGASPQHLRSGPAHVTGTPMPGDVGNSVIVGHNRAWGSPLRLAAAMRTVDLVVVETQPPNGLPRYAVFKVVSVRTAGAGDTTISAPSTDRRITIVTGTGGEYSGKQLVITAVSGDSGRVLAGATGPPVVASSGSRVWNSDVLFVVAAFACAIFVLFLTRRRYHRIAVAAATAPLFVLAAFVLLLDLDLALGAVR